MTDDPVPSPETGADFAWRVHGALDSWTGKVDTKASIALAIESAVFGFAVSRSKKGEQLAGLDGTAEIGFYVGLGLLLIAVACALLVILPRLNRSATQREWQDNIIYFGHLRHWDPEKLATELANGKPRDLQLARQLVSMAQIAWRKHAWLQASLVSLAVGSGCLLGVAAAT